MICTVDGGPAVSDYYSRPTADYLMLYLEIIPVVFQRKTVLHLLHWSQWSSCLWLLQQTNRPTVFNNNSWSISKIHNIAVWCTLAGPAVCDYYSRPTGGSDSTTTACPHHHSTNEKMDFILEIQIQQGWTLVRNTLSLEILPPEVKPHTADKSQVEGRVWWKAPAGKIRKQKGAEIDPTWVRP